MGEGSCGVVANALDCNLKVSELEHHSHSYIYFRTNTPLGRHELPYSPPPMG